MDVVDLLAELGGVARRRALLEVVARRELEAAVESGLVRRDARGRYSLPGVDAGVGAAARCGGVLSHTSAALRHGWAVAVVPAEPHVTVSRGRRVGDRSGVQLHVAELLSHQVVDGVTTPDVTLEQCLRTLPFTEALSVADSALREGFGRGNLDRLADAASGPGSRQVRRVAAVADGLAANPFESTLRGIAAEVPGLSLRPQVWIGDVRPDLVDERLRIVAEADSFQSHGGRAALASDARRYNALVVAGWMVLRFSYEDVMCHADQVCRVLIEATALAELLSDRRSSRRRAA